jgi:hypothetical protein
MNKINEHVSIRIFIQNNVIIYNTNTKCSLLKRKNNVIKHIKTYNNFSNFTLNIYDIN